MLPNQDNQTYLARLKISKYHFLINSITPVFQNNHKSVSSLGGVLGAI